MADELGTWNKIKWAGDNIFQINITGVPTDISLGSITLPNITGTIQLARLHLWANRYANSNSVKINADQHIQVQKGAGGWNNAIKIVDDTCDATRSGPQWAGSLHYVGAIDISSIVDVFNQAYTFQWDEAENDGADEDDLYILDLHLELEVWFTIDSGVEAKIDAIETDTSDVQSEVASHVLSQSEVDSESLSYISEQNTQEGYTQSEIASHVVERSETLSEQTSFATEQNTEEGVTQSEVASHATANSEANSMIESAVINLGVPGQVTTQSMIVSHVLERNASFVGTDSEIASHALEQSEVLSVIDKNVDEETSMIASHAIANSEAMSEANSALEERDIDLSTVESSANLIEPEFSNTQSEIASHALQNSEADSMVESHILQHDTDIKGLPNIKATPEFLVVPYGVSRINVEGGITAIQTTIPIYDSAQFEDVGIIYSGTELISYTGISAGSLTGCTRGYNSTTPAIHADQAAVYNVVSYPLRLMIFDNEQNMKAPDSAPTIEIDDWAGTQEIAPVAMTLISTGLYGYNYLVYQTDVPEPKVVKYSIIVDGITTKRQSTLMMLDKPASTTDLIALVGGGNGEFAVTQDGWYDNDGIFTAWTDEMVGYLRDSTSGSRLDDVLVTAYEVINGITIRAIIPPAQVVCGVNGNYEMRLDAGTYTFKFHKDQYRFPTDEVTRVIT